MLALEVTVYRAEREKKTYETASVDPDRDWKASRGVRAGRPDNIKIQTVFRDRVAVLVAAVANAVRRIRHHLVRTVPGAVKGYGLAEPRWFLMLSERGPKK